MRRDLSVTAVASIARRETCLLARRNFFAASTLIGIIVASGGASLVHARAEEAPSTANLFTIDSPGVVQFPPAYKFDGEDAASPFVIAHPKEEMQYDNLYSRHYMGEFIPFAPVIAHLPRALDADGRPLWFEEGWGDMSLKTLVLTLLNKEQFNDLERLFDDWNDRSERMADGRWRLSAFGDAIAARFADGKSWETGYQLIQRWREGHPFSRAAALAEVVYWVEYAWNARGPGMADTVPADGWDLFNERLGKAEAVLLESKPYASGSPLWGRMLIKIGNGLNWSRPMLLRAFEEVTRDEKYYYSTYGEVAWDLTPRRGGDWKLVDAFIRGATKITQARDGYSMYARLYWVVDDCGCGEFNLFRDSLANWADMKRGFDDLIERYPHSAWLYNKYAAYACLAEDKGAYQSMMFRIGKTLVPDAWPSNQAIDLCEHKFAAKPL